MTLGPDGGGQARRDAEHEQKRRPLGEDDVLEEVRPDEVLAREGVEGRDERRDEEHAASEKGRRAERVALVARPNEVDGRQQERCERLPTPRPAGRAHAGTVRERLATLHRLAGVAQW